MIRRWGSLRGPSPPPRADDLQQRGTDLRGEPFQGPLGNRLSVPGVEVCQGLSGGAPLLEALEEEGPVVIALAPLPVPRREPRRVLRRQFCAALVLERPFLTLSASSTGTSAGNHTASALRQCTLLCRIAL